MRPEGRYFVSAVIAHTDIFKICYLMWPTEESRTGLEQHDFWVNYRFNIVCLQVTPVHHWCIFFTFRLFNERRWLNESNILIWSKPWQQSIMESSTHVGITYSQAHKDGWTGALTFPLCYHSLSICSYCCCAVHVADLLHSSVLPLPAVKSLRCSSILAHVLQDLRNWHS